MKRLLPVALLLLGTLATSAHGEAGKPPVVAPERADTVLKEAQAELARLEAQRRALAPWQIAAATTTEVLRKWTAAARTLAMAAMTDPERWPQARKDWNGAAADQALAQQEAKFLPLPATPDNAPLSAALSHLKEGLAGAHVALANFEKSSVTGKPSERGLMLDQSQALLQGLSAAAPAAEELRALVHQRIGALDSQLLLLRSHVSGLHRPSPPAPPAVPQEKKP